MLLDSGCRFEMGDSTEVHVGAGCTFEASRGASLRLGRHTYIVVEDGGTLVLRNRSRFNSNSHIRVLPGGRLIAEGATLTGDGDGMWGGIVVYGDPDMPRTATYQGSVRLENCEISHAECALSMGINMYITATRDNVTPECGFYGGGIVRATGTIFRDNRTAVIFTPYERPQSVYEIEAFSKSCFRECTFTLDDSIRFSGSGFNYHVWLDGVRDPLFLGCHFTDMRTDIPSEGYGCGIKANRSGLVVDSYEPASGQAVESRFSNFHTAVRLQNGTERFTAIRHTRFENNLVGIHALATHHTVCRSNTFQISSPIPNTMGNAYGLLLEQSWAADVRDNDFTGSNLPGTAGVLVYASGPEAGCVRNNTFHHLCAGVLVSGSNADLGSDTASCGLTACCNEFRNNGSDIHIRDAATMAVAQGAEGHATGNTFLQSSANIQKLNMQRMLYYYNSNGAHHYPASIYGNGGNLDVMPTTADDCGETYGASSGDLFTGSYSALSLQELEQAFAELWQSYTESQQNYEGRFPGNGVTSGAIIGTIQHNAFVSLQWQRQQMEEICVEAIMRVCADSIFDRQQYLQWLVNSRSVRSDYALLEDAYRNDPDAFAQLALTIPEQYAALDANEFNSLLQLYGVRNPADSVGCGWANLDGNAVTVLQDVAAMDDYAGAVAKSVLDNCYGVAYTYNDQHPAWPVGLNCLWRRDSTTTDSTDIDTTGHKLLMNFTDQDSLQDSLPHRTSYMSIFGKHKTTWAFACVVPQFTTLLNSSPSLCYPATVVDELSFLESDTCTFNGHFYVGVLREDTIHGRVYRIYGDTVEVLWCDMSLKLGDTFRLPNVQNITKYGKYYMEEDALLIADSVYYLDGRKIIRFKSNVSYSTFYKDIIPFYFIEGVGPIYGPFGYVTRREHMQLMLCVHKDDTLDFMASSHWGCDIKEGPGWVYSAVKESKRATLALQPNPAQDYILLRNEDASDLGGEVIITDAIGRVLRHCTMETAEMRINTGGYSSGTYFVRYRSRNGVQTLKFVKVQ
ncbi:MAG: T9SS type A sorting domain-containing protein [Bacteroidales bacterium]|nr:T9SS type A sorting domain-containing protein [Bacteroidales bacterium]